MMTNLLASTNVRDNSMNFHSSHSIHYLAATSIGSLPFAV